MRTVGILHPGQMGVTVAAACQVDTVWCSTGRSAATRERAESAGMQSVGSLRELVDRCDVIVSVCPPDGALALAAAVATTGFDGVYVDANAIAPGTARQIATLFRHFVDGGIIGPPATTAGTTRMYLSGSDAASVSKLWHGSRLDARPIDGGPGAASSLKMVYATWTKALSALVLGVRTLGRAQGVEDALLAEWALSQPGVEELSESTAQSVAPKAWRFAGEMDEVAKTFVEAGMHPGFGEAAASVYRRLGGFRDVDPDSVHIGPVVDAILARLPPPTTPPQPPPGR